MRLCEFLQSLAVGERVLDEIDAILNQFEHAINIRK